jgi:hypothetical protein
MTGIWPDDDATGVLKLSSPTTVCAGCGYAIHPGQLWIPNPARHAACPSERQVNHAKRMGREP